MCIRKYLIIITLSLAGIIPTHAQKEQAEICIDFRVDSTIIDTLYSNNVEHLNEIIYHIDKLRSDTMRNIMQETFSGVASAEGNSLLSKRLETMDLPFFEQEEVSSKDWTRQLHLKTNVLGLGLAIANLAVEVDLGKHWSFTLPIYYSAWDYFKTTVKLRTLAVQPEVRYWFKPENEGWFIGAHYGLAYFNVALDGDYRYQDHNRETPATGGGVAVGYRKHLSKNKRWKLEFALGGGGYSVDYDKFYNTEVTKEGLMVESSIKKTYWGLDQAAISIAYAFDLKKKGGKK